MPAYRTGNYGGGNRSRDSSKGGRNSRDGSYTGRHSREGSYSGRNSREGSYSGRTSREGGRIIEREIITEVVNIILKGKRGEDRTKLEDVLGTSLMSNCLSLLDLTEKFHLSSLSFQVEEFLLYNLLRAARHLKES